MDDYILSSVRIDEWMRLEVVRVQGVDVEVHPDVKAFKFFKQ